MLKQVLEIVDLLDGLTTGNEVVRYLREIGADDIVSFPVEGARGHTDFVRIRIQGTNGRAKGGAAPTLGIIGRLGGIGARPERIGMVSDADGAVVALAAASKLLMMKKRGDALEADVILCTHICPNAPTLFHEPVPFMNSPVDMSVLNDHEVMPEMEAILSVDATKGNFVLNSRGIAITPTVKDGYILPVSPSMLEIASYVTGKLPLVLPLSTYDITPYGNELSHINSILQPSVATTAPVVGVAVTSQTIIPGCATGACQETDLRDAALFCIEIAKIMNKGLGAFFDAEQYKKAVAMYGSLGKLREGGK
jgi:hypothetical protein